MRIVEISIPTGKREAVIGVLDDEGIDFVQTEETSRRDVTAVVTFPLPMNAVEPVLDRLHDEGLPDDAYTVIYPAETVVSRRFEELEQRYTEDEQTDERVARQELRARVQDFIPDRKAYVIMIVASVTIATAGVLLNSAAIVVGSMVIAPLIGPAMATSVGTVIQDRDLLVEGTRLQFLGFLLAIITAAVFAWLLKTIHLVPPGIDVVAIDEVKERLAPDFLSLAVALGAGVAGAYSLSAGVSTALVGVMIAVALVPPTAVIGIGIAWGLPTVVVGSSVLVVVNFVSINLAALVVLWYQGYRPKHWFQADEARSATRTYITVLVAAIAVLSLFLGAVTYSSFQTATFEQEVRDDVHTTLSAAQYSAITLIDLEVETEQRILVSEPTRIVITLGRPPGEQYPGLAEELRAAIGTDVVVEVRFLDVQTQG